MTASSQSICDNVFRVTPGTAAGGAPSAADASLATNPATAQIAQDAKPVKPRRVSMMTSLLVRIASVRTSVLAIIIRTRWGARWETVVSLGPL